MFTFQILANLIKDFWSKNKGALLIIFLAGVVWYFVPRSVEKGDKAQQEIIEMQAQQIQYWKTSSENWQNKYFQSIIQQRDELKGIADTVSRVKSQVVK